MPTSIKSFSSPIAVERRRNRQAEVLEWIGTAYGRRDGLKSQNASERQRPASPPHPPYAATLRILGNPKTIVASVMLIAGLLTFAFVAKLQRAAPSAETRSAGVNVAVPEAAMPDATMKERSSLNSLARQEAERVVQDANDAISKMARERDARNRAEAKTAERAAEVAALKIARETAERTANAETARLDAERAARKAADDAAAAANEKLAHLSREPSPELTPPVAAAPAVVAVIPAPSPAPAPERQSTQKAAAVDAQSVAAPTTAASSPSNAAELALQTGQSLLAKGNVDDARQHFEKAADLGLPEAALALGNTFDPTSLGKLHLKQTGDPARARQWYRRAYALALRRK